MKTSRRFIILTAIVGLAALVAGLLLPPMGKDRATDTNIKSAQNIASAPVVVDTNGHRLNP